MPRVDGLVVLIDEQDDLLAVVLVQVGREIQERAAIEREVAGAVEDLPEASDLDLGQRAAVEQVTALVVEVDDLLADRAPARLVGLRLGAFEVEEEDRITLEGGAVLVARLPDREILEEVRESLVGLLEPAFFPSVSPAITPLSARPATPTPPTT
jgi:hypothetical protein